ncbi:hypothetical protein [Franzmannia pantelleriensis]|nr:hypothetical protein [Halomonas pantelleriensis]
MKISSAPVSYQTHVRPSQAVDMIRHCKALQRAFDRLTDTSRDPRRFLDTSATYDPQMVAMQWVSQREVPAFREAALNNHFICANWKTFDELKGDGFRSKEAVLTGRPLVPGDADFMWLRRFIHSVVVWETSTAEPNPPTLRVAAAFQGWSDVANALQRELERTSNNG